MRRSILFAAAFAAPFATLRAAADDGGSMMRKLSSRYAALGSYTQQSTITIVTTGVGSPRINGTSWELRFRRPNRLYIHGQNPENGVVVATANGSDVMVYRAAINTYRKAAAPESLRDTLTVLEHMGIRTMLDPLAFLGGDPVKDALTNVRTAGAGKANGVPCLLVKGDLKPALRLHAKSSTATFWIDRSGGLLRRMELRTTGVPAFAEARGKNGKPKGAPRRIEIGQTITVNVQEMRPNAPLADSAFAFEPPKSAVEQRPVPPPHR